VDNARETACLGAEGREESGKEEPFFPALGGNRENATRMSQKCGSEDDDGKTWTQKESSKGGYGRNRMKDGAGLFSLRTRAAKRPTAEGSRALRQSDLNKKEENPSDILRDAEVFFRIGEEQKGVVRSLCHSRPEIGSIGLSRGSRRCPPTSEARIPFSG